MPLEVANQPALLPPTGGTNLNTLVSPAQNIVHGYNMTEQTCFHKTTVSNVIPGFSRLSELARELGTVLQHVTALLSSAGKLVADVIAAVGLTRTMLTAATTVIGAATSLLSTVTTLVGTVIGLLTTVIGLVTSIIASLGGIATACLVAGIATIAAGVLFGFGFVGAGGIALTVLLAVVFFVVRSAVLTIATALGGVTTALGTLTTAVGTLTPSLGTLNGALLPLNSAVGAVNGILDDPNLPSDVTRSLSEVSTALNNLQSALSAGAPFSATLANTALTLKQRADALQTFLNPTPIGQPKVPREHLEDAYVDARTIYNNAVAATMAASGPVWDAMRLNANNSWQVEPSGTLDQALRCTAVVPQG